jgi:large subunit ribosomal protein L22
MISKASAMYARISPRKARMIANLIRGKDAAQALQLLQFTTKAGAPVLKKVIESAVANAKVSNPGQDVDALFISKATVDKGPNKNMRRWRPRAMGRATRVTKGVSHIVIELDARLAPPPYERTNRSWDKKPTRMASGSASSRRGRASGTRTSRTSCGSTRTFASSAR